MCRGGAVGAAFRVRTAARRPEAERWSAEAIMEIDATPRIPQPEVPGRADIPTPKQARVLQRVESGVGAAGVEESSDVEDNGQLEGQGEARDRITGDEAQIEEFLKSLDEDDARDSGFYDERTEMRRKFAEAPDAGDAVCADGGELPPPPTAEVHVERRDFRITRKLVEEFGATEHCRACEVMQSGARTAHGGHNAACRLRFEGLLSESDRHRAVIRLRDTRHGMADPNADHGDESDDEPVAKTLSGH